MYIATIGGFCSVPNPLVLFLSNTTLPDHTSSVASLGIATGCCFQCTRSVLVACPQEAFAAVVPSGLY